jgi:hypothetical protein
MTIHNIPPEMMSNVFYFLDTQSLGTFEQVSHYCKELAGDDVHWKKLFERIFKAEVPDGKLGKECLKNVKVLHSDQLISKEVRIFLCYLKWEKKTRLECIFPGTTIPPLVIEQSFGPNRGTMTGFLEPADETKNCIFLGNVGSLKLREIPLSIWTNSDLIHRCTSFQSDVLLPEEEGFANLGVVIKEVDVGYGNTLGYFSDINDWKEPFELFCVSRPDGHHIWTGMIPYSKFKFVKIDPKGNITWENISGNRNWQEGSFWPLFLSLEEYLRRFPIRFDS